MSRAPSQYIDLKAALMMLILGAVWGGSFFFGAVAVKEVPPLTITLHRTFWASLILLAILMIRRVKLPRSLKIWRAYLVMGALNNAIPFSLIFWGQTLTSSGLASILNATTAMFGPVIAGLMLKDEPLTRNKVVGAFLGVIGVAIIMGPDALANFSLTNLAQLAILGAAISYSFAGVWARNNLSNQPPMTNAFGMLAGATLLMIPIAYFVDGPPSLTISAQAMGAIFAIASLSTAFAYMLYFAVLARAGSANLMLVTLLIPPFSITLGALFLGETLALTMWVGFLVIAIGLTVTDGRILTYLSKKFT